MTAKACVRGGGWLGEPDKSHQGRICNFVVVLSEQWRRKGCHSGG